MRRTLFVAALSALLFVPTRPAEADELWLLFSRVQLKAGTMLVDDAGVPRIDYDSYTGQGSQTIEARTYSSTEFDLYNEAVATFNARPVGATLNVSTFDATASGLVHSEQAWGQFDWLLQAHGPNVTGVASVDFYAARYWARLSIFDVTAGAFVARISLSQLDYEFEDVAFEDGHVYWVSGSALVGSPAGDPVALVEFSSNTNIVRHSLTLPIGGVSPMPHAAYRLARAGLAPSRGIPTDDRAARSRDVIADHARRWSDSMPA